MSEPLLARLAARGERLAVAALPWVAPVYRAMPQVHEVLWFVKDVSLRGKPVENNMWMLSHEWKGEKNGRTFYYMVGFFADINFETGAIALSSNRFWRALYEEAK